MAMLTAGFVWAAVLSFTVLGVGASGELVDLFELFFGGAPPTTPTPVKIFCKEDPNLYVTIRDDAVVLAPADSNSNKFQKWTVVCMCDGKLTDDEGRKAFALWNEASGKIMVNKDIGSSGFPVKLADYTSGGAIQQSMLWTVGGDVGSGFREIRVLRDVSKTLNGLLGGVHDGTVVGVYPSSPDSDNAVWDFTRAG